VPEQKENTMPSRAQLLKANPMVRAARALIESNAINPDRVDLGTLSVEAQGDKSVQIRADIMLTIPLATFQAALDGAVEEIEAERAAAEAAADEPALGRPADDDEDGF
jgi:hypothetical protein